MSIEYSYISPEGFTVFTSAYLKKRGSCCRSSCLHCPYGHTVKKLGIQFQSVLQMKEDHIHEILDDIGISDFNWKSFPPEDMVFIKIKNVTSGVLFKNHIVIKHLFLKKYFTEQGLSKELIESYLFC